MKTTLHLKAFWFEGAVVVVSESKPDVSLVKHFLH